MYLEQQNHATALGQAQVLSGTGKGLKKVGGRLGVNWDSRSLLLLHVCATEFCPFCSVRLTGT